MAKKETSEIPLYSFRHPNAQRVYTLMSEDSMTQSEFAEELDINKLVEKHVRGGIPFPSAAQNQYADVSSNNDFQAAMEVVVKAQETWMSVDARVRRHFGDRVENFLEAIKNPQRKAELIHLGIMKKPKAPPKEPSANGVPGGTPGSKSSGEAPPTGGGAKPGTVST